jgi:hypothetical protein
MKQGGGGGGTPKKMGPLLGPFVPISLGIRTGSGSLDLPPRQEKTASDEVQSPLTVSAERPAPMLSRPAGLIIAWLGIFMVWKVKWGDEL